MGRPKGSRIVNGKYYAPGEGPRQHRTATKRNLRRALRMAAVTQQEPSREQIALGVVQEEIGAAVMQLRALETVKDGLVRRLR